MDTVPAAPIKELSAQSLVWVAAGSFLCTLATQGLSHLAFSWFWPREYQALGNKRLEWHTRVASTVHAIITTGLSAIVLWYEWDHLDAFIGNPSYWGAITTTISIGYFVADLLMVLVSVLPITNQKISGLASTILHHLVGITNFSLVAIYRVAFIYALLFIITEASTPFVNNRWFLAAAGQSKSKAYVANGILMVVSFTLVRVVLLPLQVYVVLKHLHDLVIVANYGLGVASIFGLFAGGGLNCYWWYLMMKGLIKLLKQSSAEKKQK